MSRTLKQWEAYLVGAMPRVQLLSELGLNYEDMLEIANLIKTENARHKNVRQTTRVLVDGFPCTFVAFLAVFAAQNTEREFWDAVARQLDVSGGDLNNANWRKPFIDILKKNNKPTFENVGHLYVGNMRIHGGIPAYSLRDFFANMLMPAIEKPEYIELKGKELLDALFLRSVVQLFTDSTVRNFFEFSGDIGLEFLESSRRVAREYKSKRQVPPDHILPSYVVQKLIIFLENHEDEKHGLRRPRVQFDADEGLVLELPEQILSGTNVRGYEARWQVYQGSNIVSEEKVHIKPRGRTTFAKKTSTILGYVLDPFQVSFSVAIESGEFHQLREWTFDVRSHDVPDLLVFRKEDGSLLRWPQALPAQDLILVYPSDITLQFEGSAHLSHELNLQATGWQQWKAELWSLQNAWSLNLFKGDEKTAEIQIQKQLELPRLIGEIFVPNLDPKPLYVGASPILRIPLRSGVTVDDELKHWQAEINSTWEAAPSLRQVFKLSEKPESITTDESAIQFDLGAVLGTEPKGTYALRVRGPLDTDVEFPFRVWHSLHIEDLPEFILPSENQSITFHITLPASAKLEVLAGSEGISLKGEHGRYAVELDETASRVDLNLIWSQEDSTIHVPFSLPIPRLEWRFSMGEDSKLEWSSRPIRKSLDAFIQATQIPTLHVRLPGIEKIANQIFLRLVDPENPAKISQRFLPEQSALGSDHIHFSLNARDTLNHFADVSVFEFHLEAPFGKGNSESVTLLSLTRAMEVSNVRITKDSQFLLWDEPAPLRNRRVFIRSQWKGWADSWNIKIPDDVRGKFDLLTAGYGLPPSWYEVYFYVASSWEKDITPTPQHSTFIVRTISPNDQIAWLDINLQKYPERSFVNHFERACIYATMSERVKRTEEIQFCYSHVEQAKPKDLFAFHEWLEKYDLNTRRALRMKMYNPEQLQRLFSTYKPGDEFRQKYQSYIPETNIKPESAILLIENQNDPSIVFHALRELVKRRDHRLLGIIALMLEDGRLSDADALALLWLDGVYFVSELDASQPSRINLRLLSGLLRDQDKLINALSNEKIISLAKAEMDLQAIKKYLGILIERKDKHGVEFIMELFQNGRLLGAEVTELLSKNPKFSMQVLLLDPHVHANSVQISELAQKFPYATGHVSAGMFVKTPAGWGEITMIGGINGIQLKTAVIDEGDVKFYYLTFDSDLDHPIRGIVDVDKQELRLLNTEQVYKCGNCGFISNSQNYIVRFHTREMHKGFSPTFNPIPHRMTVSNHLQFSQSKPEK